MNNIKKDIQENAKSDWMKIVNRHKKKQKGLPALSKLNTDAGNVEHNVKMFNDMNSPLSTPSTNPVSGPFGEGVAESVAQCEDFQRNNNIIELEYENIPVEIVTRYGNPSGYYSPSLGAWLPDEGDTVEGLIDWTYEVDKQDLIEFLQEDADVQLELGIDNLTDEEFDQKLLDNFDFLLEKYMNKILEYYLDDAIEDAQENYEYEEDYPEYDPYDESFERTSDNIVDDNFDMSMRTLL